MMLPLPENSRLSQLCGRAMHTSPLMESTRSPASFRIRPPSTLSTLNSGTASMCGCSMDCMSLAAMSPEESMPNSVPSSFVMGRAAMDVSVDRAAHARLMVTPEESAGGVS